MVSIGTDAYVDRLIVRDNLLVNGEIASTHKKIGTGYDTGELHHVRSMFYLKYEESHQCSTVTTSDGSSLVLLELTANHGLTDTDTIHIGSVASPNGVTVNGMPISAIKGTHLVTAVPDDDHIVFDVGVVATNDGVAAGVSCIVRIHRYKSLDMAGTGVTWEHSTTEPTGVHANPELFFF